MALTAYDAAEGSQEKEEQTYQLWEKLAALNDSHQQESSGEFKFVTDDLDELVNSSVLQSGLRWRLPSLNKSLGSLRKGDFGFVFARPETGKTTFLASEVSYMAEQADSVVLHLNNEEQSNKVKLRYYQAVLGWTLEQIYSNIPKAKEIFLEKTQGKLLISDFGQFHRKQVDRLCERYKPALIVVDQIDKTEGFNSDREDLRLGAIYQWWREIAKRWCPVIGICQADGSGEGQRWLTMGNVANAKTAKQAEADWILGIGKVNDAGYDKLRFMCLSKNKLIGDRDTDGALRHNKWETLIIPERALYQDL